MSGVIKGNAYWCHLADTETFNGVDMNKYSVTLEPSAEDMQNIIAEATTVWEEFAEKLGSKRMQGDPNLGSYKEDDNGNATIKFVTTAHIKTKTGKEYDKVVPVFDGTGRPVSRKIKGSIGNGSVVAVAYQFFPYYNTSKNFGVSFRLDAVQLLKYVPYGDGASAESFGFTQEKNAFDASSVIDADAEEEVENIDVPFTDGDDGDDF
ncbi:hypothetical protein I3700191H1_13810 [Megasphaera massiliensis]|uniref:hypothetical protein n=1 Tax=Megasphaera massiliensis TaxID=1232428 RepID=UPI0034C2AD42